jgi:hypothetical protein
MVFGLLQKKVFWFRVSTEATVKNKYEYSSTYCNGLYNKTNQMHQFPKFTPA